MSGTAKLLYLGRDTEYAKKFEDFFILHIQDKFEFLANEYVPMESLAFLANEDPSIVYVDCTNMDSIESLCEEIVFLKKIEKFKSILFVALVKDGHKKKEQMQLFASGFQMTLVKGSEFEDFLADSLYIGIGLRIPKSKYAQAKGIELELVVGVCSTLSKITSKNFYLETDIEVKNDNLGLRLHMFKDLETRSFKVKSHQTDSICFLMTDGYCLDYPFAGPWDEVTNETLQKETVETWLDSRKDKFLERKIHIKVLCKNTELYGGLSKASAKLPIFLELSESLDQTKIEEELASNRPGIVFLELEVNSEGETSMEHLTQLIMGLKKIEKYTPILVISNSPTKVDAFKKVYGYENMISLSGELNIEIIELFVHKFLEKNVKKSANQEFYFSPSDPIRPITVDNTIYITSLTEQEITFVSKEELPMFCVLFFELPIECFVTLIPSYRELESTPLGEHYTGVIHGITEEERKNLRRFVNQTIHEPVEVLTRETVRAAMTQKPLEIDNTASSDELAKDSGTTEKEEFKRPPVTGKSKL